VVDFFQVQSWLGFLYFPPTGKRFSFFIPSRISYQRYSNVCVIRYQILLFSIQLGPRNATKTMKRESLLISAQLYKTTHSNKHIHFLLVFWCTGAPWQLAHPKPSSPNYFLLVVETSTPRACGRSSSHAPVFSFEVVCHDTLKCPISLTVCITLNIEYGDFPSSHLHTPRISCRGVYYTRRPNDKNEIDRVIEKPFLDLISCRN